VGTVLAVVSVVGVGCGVAGDRRCEPGCLVVAGHDTVICGRGRGTSDRGTGHWVNGVFVLSRVESLVDLS